MVLFYEDDHKSAPATGKKKYIRRAIKVTLLLVFLLSISMWVMSSLGGNSKALRLGIQDYLTDTTGYLAEMGTLHNMSFFPVSNISFEKLTFHKPVKKQELTAEEEAAEKTADAKDPASTFPAQKTMADYFDAGEKVAHIGKGQVTMGFWDMFLSRRRFLALELNDVHLNPGIWLPEEITLSVLKVIPDADFPAIVATGTYGKHKLDLKIKIMQEKDKSGIIVYQIPDETPVAATMGPLVLEGTLETGNGMILNMTSLKVGDTEFSGTASLDNVRNGRHIRMDLKTGGSHLTADIETTLTDITGTVSAPVLDLHDIAKTRRAYADIKDVLGLTSGNDKISFGHGDMNIKLVVEKLVRGQAEWGQLKADLQTKPYILNISNISGLINGGALKGDFLIDATGKEPFLKSEIHLRGWDYARLQSEVTGQADTHVTLAAQGQTLEALEKNLTGEMVTVAGQGELSSDSVLYWGGGLLNAMLPSLSGKDPLKMNCMVADFDVKGTKAKVQTLFMDLTDLTIVGDGSINLEKLSVDLTLKPNPKEISLLDGGVAVHIQGPIESPAIEPDRFSVGKKIGGLLLGTINPAFFALSLTDLGLNESHPCRAYIKQP